MSDQIKVILLLLGISMAYALGLMSLVKLMEVARLSFVMQLVAGVVYILIFLFSLEHIFRLSDACTFRVYARRLENVRRTISGEWARFRLRVNGHWRGRKAFFRVGFVRFAAWIDFALKPVKGIKSKSFYLVQVPQPTPDTMLEKGWLVKRVGFNWYGKDTEMNFEDLFERETVSRELDALTAICERIENGRIVV